MDEDQLHIKKTKIANHAKRNEKTAWERKQKKLQKLIDEDLTPIQEQERELILKKTPILDQIGNVQSAMVETCIHPYDMLAYLECEQVFLCKFCDSKINVE